MKNLQLKCLLWCLIFSLSASLSVQASPKKTLKEKRGILLVAFGTTVPSAKVALDNIDEEFKAAFPNEEIRWAYTAKFIRNKLKKRGEHWDSPAEALAKMGEEGFTHVYVQSLHSIPGEEYHNLIRTVHAFQRMPKGTQVVKLGTPLLSTHEDMLAAVEALKANFPKERKSKEAVVFMGHGSSHAANIYYPGLQYYLWESDPLVYVGALEGAPVLEQITPKLKANKVKKVWIMPFMSVAGDHAKNDMAGPEEDSWKSQLEAQGFEVEAVLKGTGEMDEIVQIWVNHLKGIFPKETKH